MCPFVLICCSVASVRSALGTVLRELRKASQGELVARSFWSGASETVHWEAGARACSLSPKDDSIHMLNSKHNRHTHSKMEGQAAQCSLPLVRREGGASKTEATRTHAGGSREARLKEALDCFNAWGFEADEGGR